MDPNSSPSSYHHNQQLGVSSGRNPRHSNVLKPVRPPVVPGGSAGPGIQSFGQRSRDSQSPMNKFQTTATLAGGGKTVVVGLESPGQDSIDRESTVSCMTTESTSSGNGCRNSIGSTDSGRGSVQHNHPHPNNGPFQHQLANRPKIHSSSSSIVSGERGEDMICPVNVASMMESGLPDAEILNAWLTDMNLDDYCQLFTIAGYDMYTITRMTPEDLTAIGIQKPNHRKKLKAEISKLNIGDGLPDFIPDNLDSWLHLIRLSEYGPYFRYQGYNTIDQACNVTVEDLEDFGIVKLGHQKRFLLAVKKIRDIKSGKIKLSKPVTQPQAFTTFHNNEFSDHSAIGTFGNWQQSNGQHQQQQQQYQPDVIQIVRPISRERNVPPVSPVRSIYPVNEMPSLSTTSHFSSQTISGPSYGMQNQNYSLHTHLADSNLHYNNNTRTLRLQSFDDSHFVVQNPIARVPDQLRSSGGTLPRPKGLVKPMPVAKIPANFRTSHPSNEDFKNDDESCDFSKPHNNHRFGSPKKLQEQHSSFSNKGSPSHSQQHSSPTRSVPDFQAKRPQSGGQHRSTGDVLNDIGSMLADLTDELDAMLHSEREPSSSAKSFYQQHK